MKFVPMNGKALFKRDGLEGDKVTAGGLILPESTLEKPVTGTILAVAAPEEEIRKSVSGDNTIITFATPPVKVGDRVLIGKYSGITADVEGQHVEIINLTDILGVL